MDVPEVQAQVRSLFTWLLDCPALMLLTSLGPFPFADRLKRKKKKQPEIFLNLNTMSAVSHFVFIK